MPFAQENYSQKMGTGPTVNSIADVGCFLTAFCNLLERYGATVAPPDLNNYFIQHGTYAGDGPDHDALGYGSIAAYDGRIVVTGTGSGGWPDSDNAIVKFIYKSARTGATLTHFCLVADHAGGTILDSWDGQVKRSPYGTPVNWAKYEQHVPQPIAPPPPVEAPSYNVEAIPQRVEQIKVNTHLWDLNQRSWPGMVNNPITGVEAGTQFQTSHIAHHVLGGSYYMPDPNIAQGYNIVDCVDAPTPPPVAPDVTPHSLPTAPITAPSTETYEVVRTVQGYTSSNLAINHTGNTTNVGSGTYYVFNRRDPAVNVTKTPGIPGTWINETDNVPYIAPVAPVITITPDPVAPPAWHDTYKSFTDSGGKNVVKKYVALQDTEVVDYDNPDKKSTLKKYDFIILSGEFTFTDGITYGRPYQALSMQPPRFYGIVVNKDNLQEYDDLFSYPPKKNVKTRDYLALNIDKLGKFAVKVEEKVWDIFPFKNKKNKTK